MRQIAINQFIQILQDDKDYVPALLGLATAYLMLKQVALVLIRPAPCETISPSAWSSHPRQPTAGFSMGTARPKSAPGGTGLQAPKARNHLKRISKMSYTSEVCAVRRCAAL